MLPASCKEVPYTEIADIDFTYPGTLRKKMIKGFLTIEIQKFKNENLIARKIMLLMRKCQIFINI